MKTFKIFTKKRNCYIIACALMFIAFLIGYGKYSVDKTIFFGLIKYGEEVVILSWTIGSMLLAILLYSGVIIRNFNNIWADKWKFLMSIFNILFLSGFVNVFLDEKATIFKINVQIVLIGIIAFTWIGVKSIAGFGWILAVVLGMFRVSKVSDAMGGAGALYVLLAYLSIVIQIVYCKMFNFAFEDFKKDMINIQKNVKKDVDEAKEVSKNVANKIIK